MNIRLVIRIVIPTAILVVAVWYVLRGVDVDSMIAIVFNADPLILLASLPIVLISHVIRARRWQTLLIPTGYETRLTTAFNSVMIGYAANTIIPRVGEILRGWVFARRQNIPVATAVSSVVIERVIDVISLLVAIGIVTFAVPDKMTSIIPGFTPAMVATRLALPVSLIAVILILIVFTRIGNEFVERIVRPIYAKLADSLLHILVTFRHGMKVIAEPKLYARLVLETIGIWVFYILPLWIVTLALPFESAHMIGFAEASIILVVVAVGVTIAPTPGALGVYQTFAQAAFVALAGATATEGLAFGILTWLVNYGVAFLVGAISWFIESRNGITWKNVHSAKEHVQ